MQHALSVTSPRTLAVLLSSLALTSLACNKDEKKTEPAAATAGAPAADAKETPTTNAPGETPGAVVTASGEKIALLTAEPEVLGHFAVANASRLLVDVKTQLVPAKYAGFLEEAALRSLLSVALEKRSNLAMNFDLAAPMGCALVEPKAEDFKIGCTFGYKGGATAFATDLGDEMKQADAAGHVAAYVADGKAIYVDALGEGVVVSSGADTFGKTQAYLQRNIVARAGEIRGDIEFVVYAATVLERYRDVLAPLMAQMDAAGTPTPSGNPAVDGAMRAWTDYRQRSGKTTLDRMSEFAQFSGFFSVEPAGVMIGGALFPKPGSRMAQDMALYGDTKLDPGFAGLAPAGTWALFAMQLSQRAYEMQSSVEGRKLIADVWAALSGRESALIEAAILAYQVENAALYDGHTMVALGAQEGGLFGLTMASRLQAGKSARETWKAWSTVFTPELVLGPEFSKYATWKFTADAATIDGVPVDRWTIEPAGEAKKKMEAELKGEAKTFVDQALGGLYLNIDRAEAAGQVVFVVAPKTEGEYMKRVLGSLQGTGAVAGQPGLTRVLARDPNAAGILAVDVKGAMAWVRGLSAYGAKTEGVPQNIGTDLGDFYLTTRYTSDGATVMEYVFSQQLIDQLKLLIPE